METNFIRLKNVADVVVSNVDKHTNDGERPVLLCNYVDVYKNTYIESTLHFMKATATEEQVSRYSLRAGDVIITKDSETPTDIAVPALVTENVTDLVCGYHLAIVRADATKINPRYLLRVFQAKTTASYFATNANGITRYGLTYYSLKNAVLPLPSLSTQEMIADFLDRETSASDDLIAKYERLIELLEEKRVSLITQAVTRGLDPYVPMKDSGVQWIGKVPATWSVAPLRRFSAQVLTGGTPSAESFSPAGLPWYTPSTFQDDLRLADPERRLTLNQAANEGIKIFPAGSVLMVSIGATLGKVAYSPNPCTSNQQINAVIPSQKVDGSYLTYALHASKQCVLAEAVSSTLAILNQNRLKNIPIPVPSLPEQRQIITHIEEISAKLDELRVNIIKVIQLINERRATLINDAVSGQIDVSTCQPKTAAEVA